MACGNLLSLTRGKRLGHIFLLHHLNLMLGHFTFLYFNSLVYLREWLQTLVHWLVFSKVHAVTSQLPGLAVICVLFPLSRSWFHISNKIFWEASFCDPTLRSWPVWPQSSLWLLDSPLRLAAQVESRNISVSDLDHEPKGNSLLSCVGCRVSRATYRKQVEMQSPNLQRPSR